MGIRAWFVLRREIRTLRRVIAEIKASRNHWRTRALSLEKKIEERFDFDREHDLAVMDRFLTGIVKTHATRHEVENDIRRKALPDDKTIADAREAFLADKLDQLKIWAFEAGQTEQSALDIFEENRENYDLEFEGQYERAA